MRSGQTREVGWVASEREGHERGTESGHENVGFWKAGVAVALGA
jgi:hypothetical protein